MRRFGARFLVLAAATLAVLVGISGQSPVPVRGAADVAATPGSTSVNGPAVAGFTVTDDLSLALIGLVGAQDLTFVGDDGSFATDAAGILRIPLDFATATAIAPATLTLTVAGSPADVLQVHYYSAAFYHDMGVDSAGVIDLYTTLPRANNQARQEISSAPTSASLAVDVTAWTQLFDMGGFDTAASTDGQLRRLYMQFDALNSPAVGTVCDSSMTGIQTYWSMANGSCYVVCTGYATITRDYLRSLGTPARYISIGGPFSYLPDGVLVESSESHDTADMWLDGRWQWIDPTLRVLRATGPDGLALTLDEVMQSLAGASTRDGLSFTRLDPTTDEWQTLSYQDEDAAFQEELSDLLSADKIMIIPDGGAG